MKTKSPTRARGYKARMNHDKLCPYGDGSKTGKNKRHFAEKWWEGWHDADEALRLTNNFIYAKSR